MRKCPSCGKGVPVGAKRCIYCHASVKSMSIGEDREVSIAPNPSHTLLGIPGARAGSKGPVAPTISVDEDSGAQTQFGIGGRSRGAPLGGRKPQRGVRNTLMGLGSIKVLNEPGGEAERPFDIGAGDKGPKVRSTVAGMPALNLDGRAAAPIKGLTLPRSDAAPRGTMMGMPAVARPAAKAPVPDTIVSPVVEEVLQLDLGDLDEVEEFDTSLAGLIDDDQEEEFDPLAGMAGVHEPKVSSLIDEEVEDLSAAVFGSEFAFGEEEEFDDEDDDFDDFDFPDSDPSAGESESAPQTRSGSAIPRPKDVPEEDVHHDIAAAEAALADMMLDLEDVMPTEDEAAASLGLDEDKVAEAHAAATDEKAPASDFDEAPTIADADMVSIMQEVKRSGPQTIIPDEPEGSFPTEKATPLRKSPGVGAGGMVAIAGAIASVVWLLIPTSGGVALANLGSFDVASTVLAIFSLVSAVLAGVTISMKLPAGSKGIVLAVLGVGLGVLSVSAPVMQAQTLAFVVYAAAALLILGGVLVATTGGKKK